MGTAKKITDNALLDVETKHASKTLRLVSGVKRPVKVRAKLRVKPHAKLDMHKLPFVGHDHVKSGGEGGSISFWDVPLVGGFWGGQETGKAVACMYLAHIWRQRHDRDNAATLQRIILDLMDRTPQTPDEKDSLRGQVVGFGSTMFEWLIAAVSMLDHKLDTLEVKKLISMANDGFDKEAASERFSLILTKAGYP